MSAARENGGGAPVILLYHQVGTPATDPFHQFVSTENFAGHMQVVARRRPVSLLNLVAEVRDGTLREDGVAVTFDDGYVSNLRVAKPLLEREQVPATVFVTSGATGGDREFWWNDLALALSRAPASARPLALAAGRREREWNMAMAERPERLFEIWAWIRSHPPGEIARLIAAVLEWAGLDAGGQPSEDSRCMTVEELRELVDGGLVDVGAHTRTHPMLAACSVAEQRDEIAGSRADLERWLARPVTTFAYPFGGRVVEYRAAAVGAVRAGGFEAAVAVREEPVTARSPRLELPRHAVPDLPPDAFERWLAERMDRPPPARRLIDAPPVRLLRELRAPRDRL